MLKQTIYLVGLLMLLAGNGLHAQVRSELSLAHALALGISNYPALAENQARINAAHYRKQLVNNKYLPQLQTQLQNTYGTYAGSTGAFFPLPGIFNVAGSTAPENQPNATANLYGSVVMDWQIYAFGRRAKELQVARLQENRTQSSYSAAQLAVQGKISSLYLDIIYNQINEQWAQTNATRMQEILALASNLAQAGLKPGADTLLVLSAYQQALADGKNWQGKALASNIQLTEILAEPTDSFTLPGKAYLTAAPTDFLPVRVMDSISHPYLRVLQQQVKIAEVQRQLVNRRIFPTLSVLGGVSTRGNGISPEEGSNQWATSYQNRANNYLLGVGLTWNVNTAYNTRLESRIAAQQILAEKSGYETQALRLKTTLQATAARLKEQQAQILQARQAVQHAQKAYELYVARYESGLISLTELLQLQFLLQQSEKIQIEAYRQFWTQVVQQSELTGDFSYLSNQF